MIFALAVMFMCLGVMFMISDFFFIFNVINYESFVATYNMFMPLRFLGVVFFFIGLIVAAVRIQPNGLNLFMDMPSGNVVPLLHSRVRGKDPDAKFLKGKRIDLEVIRAKNKIFKDIGGGFRIAGHACRRTYETISFTVPDWLSEYLHTVKENFAVSDSDDFRELREKLLNLKEPGSFYNDENDKMIRVGSLESQLREIKSLESILNDPVKKQYLLDMGWKKLRKLELQLFDGVSHNGEEVELLIDSATPNELDVLERQTFINEITRERNYKDPGQIDFARYVPWIVFLILGATVAAIMLHGTFGGG